jgi:hypothetical protein
VRAIPAGKFHPVRGPLEAAGGAAELQTLRRRLADLESENARLATSMKAIEARLERLEHAGQDQPKARVVGSEESRPDVTEEKAEPYRRAGFPRWASNEAVGLAAAVGGGTLTTVADLTRVLPATYAGVMASALGVGAAGIGWYRKHREEKDAPGRRH